MNLKTIIMRLIKVLQMKRRRVALHLTATIAMKIKINKHSTKTKAPQLLPMGRMGQYKYKYSKSNKSKFFNKCNNEYEYIK